jgi:hypothetical protein
MPLLLLLLLLQLLLLQLLLLFIIIIIIIAAGANLEDLEYVLKKTTASLACKWIKLSNYIGAYFKTLPFQTVIRLISFH